MVTAGQEESIGANRFNVLLQAWLAKWFAFASI
jgi:hypothetical protein